VLDDLARAIKPEKEINAQQIGGTKEVKLPIQVSKL
jgi:hypothetical protein